MLRQNAYNGIEHARLVTNGANPANCAQSSRRHADKPDRPGDLASRTSRVHSIDNQLRRNISDQKSVVPGQAEMINGTYKVMNMRPVRSVVPTTNNDENQHRPAGSQIPHTMVKSNSTDQRQQQQQQQQHAASRASPTQRQQTHRLQQQQQPQQVLQYSYACPPSFQPAAVPMKTAKPQMYNGHEELESLRSLCQSLERQLRQQMSQISNLEKIEKKTAELGAQWNFFHHSQMQKQAMTFQTYVETRDLEWRAVQIELQNKLASAEAEIASLKGKLTRVDLIDGRPKSSSTDLEALTVKDLNRDLHENSVRSVNTTREKIADMVPIEEKPASESNVVKEEAEASKTHQPDSTNIPGHTITARPADSSGSPMAKLALGNSLLRAASTPVLPSMMAALGVDRCLPPITTTVKKEDSPLTLVDGILPLPIPSQLENIKSIERYVEPKIAEIRQSPSPLPEAKRRKYLPKIETSP